MSVPLHVGDPAPEFSLPAYPAGNIALVQYRGQKNVVLYFYPRDNTEGCTREACDFRDYLPRIADNQTVVLGVSTDSVASHQGFAETYSLPFPLLADLSHNVADKYGMWVEKTLYGKTSMGMERSTFLIDKQGRIAAMWRRTRVDGHVSAVAAAVAELNTTGKVTPPKPDVILPAIDNGDGTPAKGKPKSAASTKPTGSAAKQPARSALARPAVAKKRPVAGSVAKSKSAAVKKSAGKMVKKAASKPSVAKAVTKKSPAKSGAKKGPMPASQRGKPAAKGKTAAKRK